MLNDTIAGAETLEGNDLKKPVIGIGEILWDLLPGGKKLGGTVMNVAHHVHQLGERAEIVSCVGADALGAEVRVTLRGLGLGDRFVTSNPDRPTGTVDVTLGPGGQPSYTIHHRVAWDGVPLTPAMREAAYTARAICFGTLAQRTEAGRDSVQTLVRAVPSDAVRVFDINLRRSFSEDTVYASRVIEESLQLADVFKLNHEELEFVADLLELPHDEDAFARAIGDRYSLRLVALTRGDGGSILYTNTERDQHPGFPIDVVDTVGAGDAFTACLIVGLLRGLPVKQIHDNAAQVAAYVCTQAGGTPTLPDDLKQSFA